MFQILVNGVERQICTTTEALGQACKAYECPTVKNLMYFPPGQMYEVVNGHAYRVRGQSQFNPIGKLLGLAGF
jgi:hypothetical protein